MILQFNREQVEKLVQHTLGTKSHKQTYGRPETAIPGLWLVGDDGVYLMSNGNPPFLKDPDNPKSTSSVVVYAEECNPETQDFETWRSAKEASFGGSDDSIFIPYQAAGEPSVKDWLDCNLEEPFLKLDLIPDMMPRLFCGALRPVKPGALRIALGDRFEAAYREGLAWSVKDVLVAEMDRKDLVAYIGILKQQNTSLKAKLDAAYKAGAALLEKRPKPKKTVKRQKVASRK